jgi:class 3 adenylate cyclase
MSETRKLVAIQAADLAGFSRLASADEDGALVGFRSLRSDGRVLKRTGDGCRQP